MYMIRLSINKFCNSVFPYKCNSYCIFKLFFSFSFIWNVIFMIKTFAILSFHCILLHFSALIFPRGESTNTFLSVSLIFHCLTLFSSLFLLTFYKFLSSFFLSEGYTKSNFKWFTQDHMFWHWQFPDQVPDFPSPRKFPCFLHHNETLRNCGSSSDRFAGIESYLWPNENLLKNQLRWAVIDYIILYYTILYSMINTMQCK